VEKYLFELSQLGKNKKDFKQRVPFDLSLWPERDSMLSSIRLTPVFRATESFFKVHLEGDFIHAGTEFNLM